MLKRLALVFLALLMAAPALAQPSEAEQAAMQEAWMKAATPGAFQAFLAKKSGNWKVAGKMWMAPGMEPELSESTGTAEMVLGGRYLLEKMEGTSMGMPFQGMGLTGYDNTTGIVTSTWYDTMGTGTMVMTGKWEKPGAPLVTTGATVDPSNGLPMKLRTVTTFISDDESLFEYFAAYGDAPEAKMMELHYTRVR